MPDTNGLLPCVVAISLCANLPRPPVSPLCIRRRNRGPRLGLLRCVGQALATEAIAEHPQWQCLGSRIEYRIALPRADSGRGGLGCAVHGGRRQILGKHCESLPAEV